MAKVKSNLEFFNLSFKKAKTKLKKILYLFVGLELGSFSFFA